MAGFADYFAKGLDSGFDMAAGFENRERLARLEKLQAKKANLEGWASLTKLSEMDPATREFALGGILDTMGLDPKDPNRVRFEKLAKAQGDAMQQGLDAVLAGLPPEERGVVSVPWLIKHPDKLLEIAEKGRQRKAREKLLGDAQTLMLGATDDVTLDALGGGKPSGGGNVPTSGSRDPEKQPMPSFARGDATGVPGTELTPGDVAAAKSEVTGGRSARADATGTTGGTGAKQPTVKGLPQQELVSKHRGLQALILKAEGAGLDKEAKMMKSLADSLAKQAWTEETKNGIMLRRNAITSEVQSIGQIPEFKNTTPVYDDNGRQIAWRTRSSRGGFEDKPITEIVSTEEIKGSNGRVIAYKNTSNTKGVRVDQVPETFDSEAIPGGSKTTSSRGKVSYEQAPETFESRDVEGGIENTSSRGKRTIEATPEIWKEEPAPGGGVRLKSNKGNVRFENPQESWSPVGADDPLQKENPRAQVLRNNKGELKIIGQQGPEGRVAEMGGATVAIQPNGTLSFKPEKNVQPPGKEKAANESVESIKKMTESLDAKSRLLRQIEIADRSAKAGDDAGAFQGFLRNVREFATPLLKDSGVDPNKLGAAELMKALSVRGALGFAASTSDRPTNFTILQANQAVFNERQSSEGRRLIIDALRDELVLDKKLLKAQQAWVDRYGDAYSLNPQQASLQDTFDKIIEGHMNSESSQKLRERIDGYKPEAQPIRTGVDYKDMTADELDRATKRKDLTPADWEAIKRRARELKKQQKGQ